MHVISGIASCYWIVNWGAFFFQKELVSLSHFLVVSSSFCNIEAHDKFPFQDRMSAYTGLV